MNDVTVFLTRSDGTSNSQYYAEGQWFSVELSTYGVIVQKMDDTADFFPWHVVTKLELPDDWRRD